MEFCLHYQGKLRSNDKAAGKHLIRQQLNQQIESLCRRRFIDTFKEDFDNSTTQGHKPMYVNHGIQRFYFLISENLKTVVDLDITLLVPHKSGSLVNNGGDIDNRIKTLLDALRVPRTLDEIPKSQNVENADAEVFCLLEDDKLINRISIRSYEDYAPESKDTVRCLIQVKTKILAATWGNLNFI